MKFIALILSSFLLASCVQNSAPKVAKSSTPFPMYESSRIIQTEFPPSTSNPNFADVSKRQLFATLPYFKGESYSERLAVVNAGRDIVGSLKSHYYTRTGSAENPDRFTFNNNGYGHRVDIVRGFEGDLADYRITITDPTANTQILSVNAIYGAIPTHPQLVSTKRQWFIRPTN